jgi:hypothetical protein
MSFLQSLCCILGKAPLPSILCIGHYCISCGCHNSQVQRVFVLDFDGCNFRTRLRACFAAAKSQRAPRFTALCVIVPDMYKVYLTEVRSRTERRSQIKNALLATMYDASTNRNWT